MNNLFPFSLSIKMYSLLSLIFLLLPYSISSAPTGLECTLTWVPSGSGRVPYKKSPISSGTAVYVIRIGVENAAGTTREYYCGQLNLSENSDAFAPTSANDFIQSETYAVLTNPLNCSLRWIRVDADEGLPIPTTAVKVDESKTLPANSAYVARGLVDGASRAGTVFPGFSALHVATEEGLFVSKVYDLLTSEQPSLHATLSNFKFILDLKDIHTKSRRELFSVDRAENLYNARTEFFIHAEGRTQEVFVFKETTVEWKGISRVDINMDTWYGAPVLNNPNILVNQEFASGLGIRLERERIQTTRANFSIVNDEKAYACSFREILESSTLAAPILFKADAILRTDVKSGENFVTPAQLDVIVKQTGRSGFTLQSDGSYIGTISGTLDGRFILRTFLMTDDYDLDLLDEIGICNVHLN